MRTDARSPAPGRSRELWFTGPRVVEVREGKIPEPTSGQVLARALASGVSQGTELLLYRGEGPTPFDPSLDAPGAPTYPRRYGYAWVGEVVGEQRGGALPAGTRVFALAPHGDFHAIDVATARPIDPAIPPRRAVLAASLETAVTCVWDAGVQLGDIVIVLGGGVVGLLIAKLAASAGGRVRVVEPSPLRRAAAESLGIAAAPPEEVVPDAEADIVIEATGRPAVLERAIAHAAREAVVVVTSFYGSRSAPVPLGSGFHRRRIRLIASQVSSLPPARAARWTLERRFELVRTLLCDGSLDALVDSAHPFGDAAGVYERLDRAPGDALQTVFEYE
ncbi:MAG TPA: zinc-binding dehydrogenase [Polyangiaceae bacterium]|nr:zinc-binding dehydrogenase [Polyangiaceae bacterium]